MSALNTILDGVVDVQNSLGLQVEGQTPLASKRALPKHEEAVDASHAVFVSGLELIELTRRFGFGVWYVQYRVLITLITPNDRDMVKGLEDHAAWREATRVFYMGPAALSLYGVKKVEIAQGAFLERSMLSEAYNYNQVALIVTTYERRP